MQVSPRLRAGERWPACPDRRKMRQWPSWLCNRDTPGQLAVLDRLYDLLRGDVDHRDVVRNAVGNHQIFFVRGECHVPYPLAHQQIFDDLVAGGIDTAMRLAGPSATKAVLPSLVMPMPTGWMASLRRPGISNVIFFVTSRLTGSITETVPPISDDTHTSELSRLNSAKRGRASTSTLATIWRVAVSMKCAM